jgi:hypothetical protein
MDPLAVLRLIPAILDRVPHKIFKHAHERQRIAEYGRQFVPRDRRAVIPDRSFQIGGRLRAVPRRRFTSAAPGQVPIGHFSVADNGIGIEPRSHRDVFLPFKRLHSRS